MILKNIAIICLISLGLKAQNDSIIKHKRFENVDYKMIGIIGAVTAPVIVLYSMDAKNDKLGQIAFGSISAVSITALSTSLVLYLKSNDNKKPLLHYSCMAVAGALDGFSEELRFHYPKVKSKMPFLNDNFWNPDISFIENTKMVTQNKEINFLDQVLFLFGEQMDFIQQEVLIKDL